MLKPEAPITESSSSAMPGGLAGQRAIGNFSLLTGDRVLGNFGASQVEQAQAGAPGSLRAQTLEQGNRRLLLQALGEARQGVQGDARLLLTADQIDTAKRLGFGNLAARHNELSSEEQRALIGLLQRQEENDARREEREEKRRLTLAEREVGGFDFVNPESPPSVDAAKKMAAVVTARDAITGSLGRLQNLFDEHGTEIAGPVASQMESEWKNITDQVRMLSDMGVPNGRDYEMLAKQIPQTVGLGASTTANKTIGVKFDTLRQQVDDLVGSTAKAYKYKPIGSPSAPADAPLPPRQESSRVPQSTPKPEGWRPPPDGTPLPEGKVKIEHTGTKAKFMVSTKRWADLQRDKPGVYKEVK
ncbi:hypothetical protein [Myxococcus landrumensis]|uniref:Uncharacterized protein n=1 Tax=Myxococcus landrumensis TaxID=2813577 RepID=A0ABX7N5M4_9BACT|nr:hypothetical protein [Myxococcus landrumus]QSQ14042.1 hypothetical protein JY572_37970 [Myxococcus landrumus]